MTTLFYFESRLFETVESVESYAKNFAHKDYDVIETSKSFDEFEEAYDNAKADGNSDLDAIEWAK